MGVFTINVLGLLNPRTFIVLQFCVIAYVEQLILSIGLRLRDCINQDNARLNRSENYNRCTWSSSRSM